MRILTLILTVLSLTACGGSSPQTQTISEHPTPLAAFSPDGRYLLIQSPEQPATLWDIASFIPLYNWQNTEDSLVHPAIALTFNQSGNTALLAEPHTLGLWSTATGEPTAFWKVENTITTAALAQDGIYVLAGYEKAGSDYIDLLKGHSVRHFAGEDTIQHLVLSPDSRLAVFVSLDKHVTLWHTQTGKPAIDWMAESTVDGIAVTGDNRFVATALDTGRIEIREISTTALFSHLQLNTKPITTLNFSRSHKWLAVGTATGQITLWQIAQPKATRTWQLQPASAVRALGFDQTEQALLVQSENGKTTRFLLP